VRVAVGLVFLAGGVTVCVVTIRLHFSAAEELNLALGMGLSFLAAIALLGPLLVSVAELIARLPVRILTGVSGRLALGELRARPRRVATAVTTIALATAFLGTIYFDGATEAHAAGAQSAQRVRAEAVVTAGDAGLAPGVLRAIGNEPGISAAMGLVSTTIFIPDPGAEATAAEAVTPGPIAHLLDLHVVAGSLERFGPGDIALSQLVAGAGAAGVHVGEQITTYLADGTRYRATVSAIYSRSLGFADAIVPLGAAGGGHLGTGTVNQVLVNGSPATSPNRLRRELASLATSYPGLHVVGRRVANANDELLSSQTSYENVLVLVLVGLLAGIALVNTLVMATFERRDGLRLLRRVGATRGQISASAVQETALVAGIGLLLGAATAGIALAVVSRALTGSAAPFVTWAPVAVIVGVVGVLTSLSMLLPTRVAIRGEMAR
jgi:putative ABC transport system permease protein